MWVLLLQFCGLIMHIYVEMLLIFMGHIISPMVP